MRPCAEGTCGASVTVTLNDLALVAAVLPSGKFGIFVTSRTQAFIPMGGGTSNGNHCLGGNIGRFNAAGQILKT